MQYYMMIGVDGRVLSVADTGYHCSEGEKLVDVPEGFTLAEALDWRMVDGALLYDPLPVDEVTPTPSDPIVMPGAQNTLLKAQIQALEARGEFLEDCIAEMAMQVYGS